MQIVPSEPSASMTTYERIQRMSLDISVVADPGRPCRRLGEVFRGLPAHRPANRIELHVVPFV